MALEHEQKTPSGGEVWNRLNQQSDFIGELARNQAALEANVASLAESVKTGFDNINDSLTRFSERENRPTNWIGLGSFTVILVGAMLTFVSLQTDPVRTTTVDNASQIEQMFERELQYAYDHGKRDAMIEHLAQELEKVDQFGSRRWIKEK